MINEIKLKKIISYIILILGSVVNIIGFIASRGSSSALSTVCGIMLNFTLFAVLCLWLKKYDLYIKMVMFLFGMCLFPIILIFSAVPHQALLYNFIIPGFYAVTIRKKRNIILPFLNGLLIAAITFYRINLINAIIFFLVYCFNIIITALFTMTLYDNFQELERTYSIIADIAKKDRLTGIYNRFGLENFLKKKGPVMCHAIMMDIDYFKQINDTYGHEAGDDVLFKFGTVFKKHSSKDFVVSRRGGEEFLLYSFYDYEKTLEIITSIYASIDENVSVNGIPVHISTGISGYGYAGEDLVSEADKNLYLAKQSGRNMVCSNMEEVKIERRQTS